jgi:hypothetical protein
MNNMPLKTSHFIPAANNTNMADVSTWEVEATSMLHTVKVKGKVVPVRN